MAFPSRSPCGADWSPSRRGCHCAVLILGCEIPPSGNARTRPTTPRRDRPYGRLPFQPEPVLFVVLSVPTRYRDLGQQRVAGGYTRRGSGADQFCRHTERRAVPGTEIRRRVLEL